MAGKIVKIFLDSNVILSGLLSERGAPRILLDLLSLDLPFLKGLTGRYNILEIERNLIKKMPGCISIYKSYFPKLNLTIISLPSPKEIRKYHVATAEKDAPVLVSALKGNADFLVSGDNKDFAQLRGKRDFPFRIVNTSEFLAIIPDAIEAIIGKREKR